MHGDSDIEVDLEEEREKTMAALELSTLKYKKLDPETAKALEAMKRKFLARARATLKQTNIIVNNNDIDVDQALTSIEEHHPPDVPPVLKLRGIVGRCSKPFEKQLTASDVRDDQSRLSINKADVEACLLPLLNGHNLEHGIPVRLYDRDGDEYSVTFKRWVGKIHVLTGTGWKQFYKKHALKQYEHFVTLWMFYHASNGDLCFAVNWMDGPYLNK
ncbi:hypothetical protein FNV43_RR15803 [Rhamnella rubrinervis]|uniref:TF-B3 domain-containing protein n=1 Tax=Rhamnella rubrinervis TaxID=2594499 RepID=A0A8K0E8H9_9ROSA|nr:hypothetical protein FNV43_RR15803 [Rhamnella rubrinervis]